MYPKGDPMAQLRDQHAYQHHLMRIESPFGYAPTTAALPVRPEKALWALAIPHSGTVGMIMRQLAQVGGIRSLRAANLRQLSSRVGIGSEM
jgi:hypothetical protein